MKAYHIDRLKILQPGDIVSITPFENITLNSDLKKELYNFFPKGLSFHGVQYFTMPTDPSNAAAAVFETIYEYHRRLFFQANISRMESLFACPDKDSVKKWIAKLNLSHEDYNVLEVDTMTSSVETHDAALVAGGSLEHLSNFSSLHTTSWANNYWSANSQMELPELLISPAFQVIDICLI
ncbi:hypothetical protein A5819_003778 [Enterococcus sp. 7E2_DIV0204]|uniref:DUF2441 domain-containing protein n=1 Tax=unclassified Enterococcus TaxID=2608891 RepID=UPI000A354BE8|nr:MULTISPECIES: DUF2441 domain-containing protein [unclassified Enterococcus]OTN83681.1 hypothetical protein A5819_003778 [Enterococcus sp. 7E2_DIV0204]OTP53064.1 hypothetical protein A5884_002267 [Enterococcus sp. 7D2_DIV0200]